MRVILARGSAVYTLLVIVLCGVVPVAQGAVIGYWRLEGSGTVVSVADSGPNNLTGTGYSAPLYSMDVPGVSILDGLGGPVLGANASSVLFGGGNYVDIPYNALLEPASFTIEFFMKAGAQLEYPGIVQKAKILPSSNPLSTAVGSGNVTWGIGKQNTDLEFARVDPANAASNKTFTVPGTTADGTWHHFAMTYDGAGTWSLYQDYTKVATLAGNYTVDYDGLSGLRFARAATDFSWRYNGLLDEVRFSNTVLTPDQFLTLAPMTLQWGAGGAGGNGTWDARTTPNWYPGSGSVDLPWSVAATRTPSEAVFAGAAGAVTIDAAGVTAKSVTFNTPGYTVAGPGKLNLTTPSVVANQDATISAPIAPPASGLNKSGPATLTLSGPNVSYVQPTTVSQGTLRLSDTANFASPVTLGGGALELSGTANWSMDAPISGAGAVMKTGANTVTLFNTNTYDGPTVIAQGTLRLGAGAVPTAGLAAWYDAGAGVTTSGANVTGWADRTGQHDATASGSPTLLSGEINGQPAVQVSTAGWLNVAGAFQARSVYTVFKSPGPAFSYYGTPFGVTVYNDGRTFIFENGQTYFHSNPGVPGVRKDGTALASPYNMAPIDQYMVLGVNTANANNVRTYQIGRSDNTYTATLNIAEILVYDHVLTSAEENLLGAYLAQKYGISTAYVGLAQDSIPNGSTVAIAGGAAFDLNGANETIGALADYAGGGGTVTNNAAGRPSVLTLAAPSGSNAFSGTIQDGAGPVSLVKQGAGAQVLAGANTYSGGTTVTAGTLLVNNTTGSGVGSGDVTVSGGTLGGTGILGAPADASNVTVNAGGHLSPGLSPGILTVYGDVTMNYGSFFDVEINGPTPGNGAGHHDQLVVHGLVNLNEATLNPIFGYSPGVGESFTLIDNDGHLDPVGGLGQFLGLPEGAGIPTAPGSPASALRITYRGNDGNDVVLTGVPEPSTLLLAALGLLALGWLACRKRHGAALGR